MSKKFKNVKKFHNFIFFSPSQILFSQFLQTFPTFLKFLHTNFIKIMTRIYWDILNLWAILSSPYLKNLLKSHNTLIDCCNDDLRISLFLKLLKKFSSFVSFLPFYIDKKKQKNLFLIVFFPFCIAFRLVSLK